MGPHRLVARVAQMPAPFVLSDTEQSQVVATWFDLSEAEAMASTPWLLFVRFCVHHGQMTVQLSQGKGLICPVKSTLVRLQTMAPALGRPWARLRAGLPVLRKESRFCL